MNFFRRRPQVNTNAPTDTAIKIDHPKKPATTKDENTMTAIVRKINNCIGEVRLTRLSAITIESTIPLSILWRILEQKPSWFASALIFLLYFYYKGVNWS